MIFTPKKLGYTSINDEELKKDKKDCIKIGPCGIGKKALYLNSFGLDRVLYVSYIDIARIYKRVAMSKNGFSGRGAFGSLAYLVAELKDGTEKQCYFKYEYEVDDFINKFHELHPAVPTHSRAAEKRMAEEKAREEARYIKNLSPEAAETITSLNKASDYLKSNIAVPDELSRTAKQKRIIDNIKPAYKYFAAVIVAFSVISCIYGVYAVFKGKGMSVYFLLFGFAFLFYAISLQVLPTSRNNSSAAQREFDNALRSSSELVAAYKDGEFPLPAQYAHPAAISRMIRIIREGRAVDAQMAYEIMKSDLKAINNKVTVSQIEYDEITAIKPMFLICGYSD